MSPEKQDRHSLAHVHSHLYLWVQGEWFILVTTPSWKEIDGDK